MKGHGEGRRCRDVRVVVLCVGGHPGGCKAVHTGEGPLFEEDLTPPPTPNRRPNSAHHVVSDLRLALICVAGSLCGSLCGSLFGSLYGTSPPPLLRLCVGAASSYPEARRLLWGFHAQMNTSDLCPFSTVTSSFAISTGSFAAHPETYWKAGVGGGWGESGERGGKGDGGVQRESGAEAIVHQEKGGGEGGMSERSEDIAQDEVVQQDTGRATRWTRIGRASGVRRAASHTTHSPGARRRADLRTHSRASTPQTHLLRPCRRRRPLPVPCMCVVGTA